MLEGLAWFFILFNATNLGLSLLICVFSVVALSREKKWMMGFEDRLKERWEHFPSITVVIPAFNEEESIVESVKAVLKSRYPVLEIVVVNDGSRDSTLETMLGAFPLVPSKDFSSAGLINEPIRGVWRSADGLLTLIDKHNGGKADAINAGINLAASPLVCVVDADTVLQRDTLLFLAEPFLDNPTLLVAGGFIRLKPPARKSLLPSLLYWLQELEFARSYGCFRAGLNIVHANVIISGALGLFRRSAIIEVGGYDPLAVGEDMELVLRLHSYSLERRRPYAILQVGYALCRTAACDSLQLLRSQRLRWQRGLLSSLKAHRGLFFKPGSRGVGFVAMPYLLVFDVFGPFVELAGIVYLIAMVATGNLSPDWLLALLLVLSIGSLNNLLCLVVDNRYLPRQSTLGGRLRMLAVGVLEPLGYHWLNLWWRVRGTLIYLRTVQTRTAWTMRNKRP